MPKKVLTIGGVLQDIFIEFKNPEIVHLHTPNHDQSLIAFEEGKKIPIDTLHTFVGGGAANTATSFKRLGFDVTSFFKIGMDPAGDFIINYMKEQGVNVDCIARSTQEQTGSSYILPCPSGNKAALVYRGANITVTEKEIPLPFIEQTDQLYITSLSFKAGALLPGIVKHAKKHAKRVAMNPGSNQVQEGAHNLIESLPFVDILILNSYESNLLMKSLSSDNQPLDERTRDTAHPHQQLPQLLRSENNFKSPCFNLVGYCKKILSLGPKIVVITNGAEGVYAATESTLYFYPSPQVPVVSSIGAGDAFGSAFVASLLHGNSIETALIAGTLNSSSVIQHIGTQTGLLTATHMDNELRTAPRNLLQTFVLE